MDGVGALECICLWRELDLFKTWFPMCVRSSMLERQGEVECVAHLELAAGGAVPLGNRDAVLHGYGVDALDDGFVLIRGASANQSAWKHLCFPRLRGFGSARLEVRGLSVMVQPLGDAAVRCSYVINIDPKAPLPRAMQEFAVQQVVGVLFHKLSREAREIARGEASRTHESNKKNHVFCLFLNVAPPLLPYVRKYIKTHTHESNTRVEHTSRTHKSHTCHARCHTPIDPISLSLSHTHTHTHDSSI